jgi:hypothetical protein
MISHILCALVLALSLAGARDVAARQRSPEPNIAHAGPAEKAFRDSRISGPSITDLPLRFGSATEPPRASPAQNSPTSSDFDKLFQAQPMSNAAQARFQKPASASADPAASSARPSAPLRPPTASRGVREDITSSLPAAAMPAPHTRREWFAWWEKCRPRVSNRKDAGKAVEQARWRLPGRQVRHTTTNNTMAKEATAASDPDRSRKPVVSPPRKLVLACSAGHSRKCENNQRIPPRHSKVSHPPLASRIVSAERVKRRRARLTSLRVHDAMRLAVVRNRRDHQKAPLWQACKARRSERS